MFGELPRKKDTPPVPNDDPEMDISDSLEDEDVEKCWSLIGQSQ